MISRHDFLKQLGEALRIPGNFQRIVIVADVKDVVRAYVKFVVHKDEHLEPLINALANVQAVEDVAVDEHTHEVIIKELP